MLKTVLALLPLPGRIQASLLPSLSPPPAPRPPPLPSARQDIYELKDQIQDVEGRYMQGLKELKVVGTRSLQHVFSV